MHWSRFRDLFVAMRLTVVGAAVLAVSCSPALAQDRLNYRCDTPNGKYDAEVFDLPPTSKGVSGKLVFHKADFDAKWGSVVDLSFAQKGSTDGDCHCAGIRLVAFSNPDMIEVRLISNGHEETIAQTTFDFPLNIKMITDEKGLLTIQLGTEHPLLNSAKLNHPEHNLLQMSCSGADVSFFNIESL